MHFQFSSSLLALALSSSSLAAFASLAACSSSTSSPKTEVQNPTDDAGSSTDAATSTADGTPSTGSCSYECLGGECLDGVCQAVKLQELSRDRAANEVYEGFLAAEGTHGYWATTTSLYRSDNRTTSAIAALSSGAHALAASATQVYYSTNVASSPPDYRLFTVPTTGGTPTELKVSPGAPFAQDMSVRGTDLFFTNIVGSGQSYDVQKVSLAGASPYPVTTLVHAYPVKGSTVGPDGTVYIVKRNDGSIYRVTPPITTADGLTAGSTAVVVQPSGTTASNVQVDDHFIYWISNSGLMRAALDGTNVTSFQTLVEHASKGFLPGAIAVGTDRIFFYVPLSATTVGIYQVAKPR